MKTPQRRDLHSNKNPLRAHGFVRHSHQVVAVINAAFWLTVVPFASADQTVCTANSQTLPSPSPLPDLGQNYYPNPQDSNRAQGGLYKDGYNQRPGTYNNRGLHIAKNDDVNIDGIYPRDMNGVKNDTDGKIVMISIGMCNTSMEFGGSLGGNNPEDGFQFRATGVYLPNGNAHPCPTATPSPTPNWKNEKLVVIDCAQSGKDAVEWATKSPGQGPWGELECRLAAFDVSKKQVQVVWLKEGLIQPGGYGDWPLHVNALKTNLEAIVNHLAGVGTDYGFGNVKIVFLSPRSRAWLIDDHIFPWEHSPEPYAYETGFADKWLIQEKIDNIDSAWPWLCWGPYLWVDGLHPRSDGLVWPANFLQNDCTHPRTEGVRNVASQLLAFFKTDPVATPWFLKPADPTLTLNVTTSCPPLSSCTNIPAGTEVTFTAVPPQGRTIAEYSWTYDDGTYDFNPDDPAQTVAKKTFLAPSKPGGQPYRVHLTAIDTSGNAGFKDVSITVTASQPRKVSGKETKDKSANLPQGKPGTAKKVVAR